MMRLRVIRFCAIAASATAPLVLSSCIRRPEVVLYNNTGSGLQIIPQEQDACTAEPGGVCRFWYARHLTVTALGASREYPVVLLKPHEAKVFFERRGYMTDILKLRIDRDGSILILTPRARWSDPPPRQPVGYPLRPSSVVPSLSGADGSQ
jgi:hypothetical protein